MAHDRGRHPWVRRIAIALALVAGYAVLGALTFQDSPNDPPIIQSAAATDQIKQMTGATISATDAEMKTSA